MFLSISRASARSNRITEEQAILAAQLLLEHQAATANLAAELAKSAGRSLGQLQPALELERLAWRQQRLDLAAVRQARWQATAAQEAAQLQLSSTGARTGHALSGSLLSGAVQQLACVRQLVHDHRVADDHEAIPTAVSGSGALVIGLEGINVDVLPERLVSPATTTTSSSSSRRTTRNNSLHISIAGQQQQQEDEAQQLPGSRSPAVLSPQQQLQQQRRLQPSISGRSRGTWGAIRDPTRAAGKSSGMDVHHTRANLMHHQPSSYGAAAMPLHAAADTAGIATSSMQHSGAIQGRKTGTGVAAGAGKSKWGLPRDPTRAAGLSSRSKHQQQHNRTSLPPSPKQDHVQAPESAHQTYVRTDAIDTKDTLQEVGVNIPDVDGGVKTKGVPASGTTSQQHHMQRHSTSQAAAAVANHAADAGAAHFLPAPMPTVLEVLVVRSVLSQYALMTRTCWRLLVQHMHVVETCRWVGAQHTQ